MSSVNLTMKLAKLVAVGGRTAGLPGHPRVFATAATRPLQSKEDKDSAKSTKEAAEAVKEGAQAVTKTCEVMRDMASSTAKSVNKMTKKVSETADNITGKTKDTVSGVWGTAKAATEVIKDKVVDN